MLKVNPKLNHHPNFKGALNNKALLRGLEFVSEHSASVSAGVAFASAMVLRPLAIACTPKVEKENKDYLSANSIASGIIKLGIVEAVALPIESAIKKIDKNPKRYLKKDTIENFAKNASEVAASKDYKFATQTIKMGANFLSAVPKSVLTVAFLPIVVDKFFNSRKKENLKKNNEVAFKGGLNENLAKTIGSVLDNKKVQEIAKKNSHKAQDIARNVSITTDVLLASVYSMRTKKSKKIEENKKNVLIANEVFSTAVCLGLGTGVDEVVKKQSKGMVDKFIAANKNDKKVLKYVEGLNVLRPTIIFALIYYGILPMASAYFTSKAQKEQ